MPLSNVNRLQAEIDAPNISQFGETSDKSPQNAKISIDLDKLDYSRDDHFLLALEIMWHRREKAENA